MVVGRGQDCQLSSCFHYLVSVIAALLPRSAASQCCVIKGSQASAVKCKWMPEPRRVERKRKSVMLTKGSCGRTAADQYHILVSWKGARFLHRSRSRRRTRRSGMLVCMREVISLVWNHSTHNMATEQSSMCPTHCGDMHGATGVTCCLTHRMTNVEGIRTRWQRLQKAFIRVHSPQYKLCHSGGVGRKAGGAELLVAPWHRVMAFMIMTTR